ncbi:MAG: hypothetical protein KC620_10935, partial [Myxococcales bacterium]|nr:hypothetical protein [Myxococcales bacterium]
MIPETILVGAALAVAVWKVYHRSKGRLAALADAAERLGIERPSSHHFSGKVDGWRVMMLPDPQRDAVELRVLSDGRWPADVGLGRESTMPSLLKMVTDGDVEIGDAAFDADVLVAGDRTWLAGALDSATRPLVSRAVRSGVVVDGGEIRMQNKSSELQAHEVVGLMRLMVRLADALSAASADLPGRLAANVQHDPEVAVRRACLSHLEAVYPDAPETARARLAALLDPDSALRLEAARNAGR